jgi:integrase
MKLEDTTPARVKVPAGKRDVLVFDAETPGFYLWKSSTGRAMWGVKYAVAGGRSARKLLRDAGAKGSLAAAKKDAEIVRSKGRLGTDINAEAKAARMAKTQQGNTIAKLVPAFLADKRNDPDRPRRPSYLRALEMHLTKHLKALASKPVKAVTIDDVVNAIGKIEADRSKFRSGGKIAARRAKASLSAFYSWAIDNRHADFSPVPRLKTKGTKGGGRERALSMSELIEVWLATEHVNDDYARIIRLLILTAQRKAEIGELPWSEVNEAENRLELPGERTKNHKPHLVPLSALALAQLPERPDQTDPTARTMVFGRRYHKGYSGWGKSKEELDMAIAEARQKRGVREPMKPWVVHDLRRSVVTQLAELGIAQPHVIEMLVNHVSGHKSGIAGTYNRATYLPERIKALDAWSAHIERLVAAAQLPAQPASMAA